MILGDTSKLREAIHVMSSIHGCILTMMGKNLGYTTNLIESLTENGERVSDCVDAIVTLKNSMGNRKVEEITFF